MLASTIKPSPFGPPKTPLRSLPPKTLPPSTMGPAARRVAPVANSSNANTMFGHSNNHNNAAPHGRMNGHAAPFAPSPSALHTDPGHQQQGHHHSQQMQQPHIPKPRQMHAPPSALGGNGVGASSSNSSSVKQAAPLPPVPQSKALPIINKQTGEIAVTPKTATSPQPPATIEAPLAPFDNEPMLPVGHSPSMKPSIHGLMPVGGESDSELGASCCSFGASTNIYADVVISEESMESQEYTREEMLSLRHVGDSCPDAWISFVLSDILPRLAPNTPVPARLRLLKDAPESLLSQERGGFGSAKGAKNALNAAAALRLRQVKETHQKVMSVLSRITPEKYEALKDELMNLPLRQTDEKQLRQVVEVFFEKAVQEPVYSQLYAALVSHMCHVSDTERQLPREERDKLFASRMRRELLNKCQEEFTKPYTTNTDELKEMTEAEVDATRRRFKKRLCGNIKFVCELYARTLVTDRVVDNILSILCAGNTDEDYVAEAIATTITSAGSIFSRTKPEEFERHMAVISKLKTSHPSTRIKFLMMDVEDCRKKGFEKKNKVMTQDELDKQQFLDQKKLQDDMDKALKEQFKQNRRQKKTIPSVPSSPVTPSRQPKPQQQGLRGAERGISGRLDPHTPTSPSAGPVDMLPPTHAAPPSPSSPPAFPKPSPGSLYSHGGLTDSSASLSSLSGAAVAPLTKDQTAVRAKDLMQRMLSANMNSVQACDAFAQMDKVHRSQILTAWLRLASTLTRLFTEREQLPGVFAAILTVEEASAPLDAVPFTSAELSKLLHDWVIVDIDSQQYDNCPRMFSNWSSVIDYASKYNNHHAPADTKVDPATVLHPGILNLFLQEYRRQVEDASVLESFCKEILAPMDTATEQNVAKVMKMVGKLAQGASKELSPFAMTLLQRFRPSAHLAYVEVAEDAAVAESVTKRLLENEKLKDDLELNLYRVYSSCDPAKLIQEAEVAFGKRSKLLSPVHNLLKATSAAVAVLLPFHGRAMQVSGCQVFAGCPTSEDRARAVSTSLKSIHNKIVLNMSATPTIAENVCGIAVLTETLQHAAFAVSTVTERSAPCSPNSQAPNAVESGPESKGAQGVQLEFQQQLTAELTTSLCSFLVGGVNGFVKESALSAVRGAMGNVEQDVWAVSPPPSLRPVLGSGGTGVLLQASQDMLSSDDLTSMSSNSQLVLNSPNKITATSSPVHSKAIANSMLRAMSITA